MANEVTEELIDPVTEKIKEANISLIINSYTDIFSDFDPRPFQERALSDDFLQECRRAARGKNEALELRILVPKVLRNQREEWKIKKRLKDHFEHHSKIADKEIRSIKREGISWFILGTFFIMSFTYLEESAFHGFLIQIIKTMLEPAGWFSFWEGLGKIFITAREKTPEFDFYQKMSKAEINFAEY
jgi:hypothetical protein